jgi:hypothetical protein
VVVDEQLRGKEVVTNGTQPKYTRTAVALAQVVGTGTCDMQEPTPLAARDDF